LLAMAGLKRAGLFDESYMTPMGMDEMLPGAGQGALAIQCRREDRWLRETLGKLNDAESAMAVEVERAVVRGLGGDCYSPIGVYAEVEGGMMKVEAVVARRGGELPLVRAKAQGLQSLSLQVAGEVVEKLVALGAREILGEKKPEARSQ
ncbi:MAG: hypothetical protein FWD61_16800, partial [Phycisphaerales bacterium]|nr:hypothetical protein [Phycisphaerales bacterium]